MLFSPIPLDNKQFLPREGILRNAKWVYGITIYTGQETKCMLNQTLESSKKSAIDKFLSLQIKIFFLFICLLSFTCAVCSEWWSKKNISSHWYLKLKGNKLLFRYFAFKPLLLVVIFNVFYTFI